MASIFGANAFSTPVGQRIERATDGALPSEDWAVNIEICDIINETDEGPKDAAKALRKRLAGNKNYKSVLLTLTVLETCVKNCGHRFHVLIAKKELLDELVKILNPKNNPPQVVQDKILALIQDWADAFRASPDLVYVVQTYNSLKEQGVEFPAQDLDTLSPIYTPERTQPERPAPPPSRPPPVSQPPTVPVHAVHHRPVHAVQHMEAPVGPVMPTPEQLAKLRMELDVVQGNMTVMSEMLTEMTPGQEEAGDLELLQELNRTCRAMQQRVLELIERVANEEVVGMLLSVNDDLNNVFIRYDRYERFRQVTGQQEQQVPAEPPRLAAVEPLPDYSVPPGRLSTAWPENAPRPPVPIQAPQPVPTATAGAGPGDSLISFDEESAQAPSVNSMTHQMQDLNVGPTSTPRRNKAELVQSADQDDEFDMFAQSRKSTFDESRKGGSSYSDNLQPLDRSIATTMSIQKTDPAAEPENKTEATRLPVSDVGEVSTDKNLAMDSVESWLEITDQHVADAAAASAQENAGQDTLSSSEFDDFLADRAAAGGQRSGSLKAGANRPRQRQMVMPENQADDEMFGL